MRDCFIALLAVAVFTVKIEFLICWFSKEESFDFGSYAFLENGVICKNPQNIAIIYQRKVMTTFLL